MFMCVAKISHHEMRYCLAGLEEKGGTGKPNPVRGTFGTDI